MDKPKSKVIKSRSSNTAITMKSEKRSQSNRKKSKSNAEFQTLAAKKRGVYVENKRANLAARAAETKIDEIQPVKPPRRPKAGSKRFLASVLTILSKSTTGTQYPDATDGKRKKKKTGTDETEDKKDKKKPKYRSKVLNNNQNQIDKFEVLQSKKEIVQTPSMYSVKSYKEELKWPELPRLVKPDDETQVATVNNLVREVIEGKKLKEKKVKIEEPTTLVSDHKDDKRIYNFFVDLLETTFSVYNVKADYDAAPLPSGVSSNIALEIDESVARKLNVGTEMYEDVTQKPSKHFHCIRNDNNNWNDKKLIDYFQSTASTTKRITELPLKSPGKRRRYENYAYTRNKVSPPQSKSVVITQRKSFYKKNKKTDLLNILKEQLRMDHVSFEEPQNLYQALKVMAKNKRKQKTIRFDNTRSKPGYRPPECMLKRRKIMTASTKSTAKYDSDMKSSCSISQRFEGNGYKEYDYDSSNHSLEVYGFDYEVQPHKKRKEEKRKEVVMPYHSSAENSDVDMLKFTENSNSTIRDFNNSMDIS